MNNIINLDGKLDFNDIDLTAPEVVTEEILQQLSIQTKGIIMGTIKKYDGPIQSYIKPGFSFADVLGQADKEINIQKELGAKGQERKNFECYIYTPAYDHYKFRVFFIQHGLSNYPVKLVLEESVAKSISSFYSNDPSDYTIESENRNQFERLLGRIFTSNRLIDIMQELIRINQTKRSETAANEEPND